MSSAEPDHGRLEVESRVDDHEVLIVLRGEADLAGVEPLRDALAGVDLDGEPHSVHIDVSHLELVDLAALRQLTFFAMQLRDSGHDVTTHGGQRPFLQLARLVGAHKYLGLA